MQLLLNWPRLLQMCHKVHCNKNCTIPLSLMQEETGAGNSCVQQCMDGVQAGIGCNRAVVFGHFTPGPPFKFKYLSGTPCQTYFHVYVEVPLSSMTYSQKHPVPDSKMVDPLLLQVVTPTLNTTVIGEREWADWVQRGSGFGGTGVCQILYSLPS